ncbi:MAG: 50S ribosomal protein L33 [Candidatus Sungbacteria bacterium]|uniref:Large ribosomal subunit protein bL33 n=1 Tax=Candidatus Sungiibacteriota bacterium TaxID=2750080 RepID=A0A9D6LTS5_9BACT|nr:50S ribosomal protein L33 [Candidatus Sungbacteria bacterium]
MPQDNLIRFQCSQCKRYNYWAHKNVRKVERKLEFKKFCKWCRKHTKHTQARKT